MQVSYVQAYFKLPFLAVVCRLASDLCDLGCQTAMARVRSGPEEGPTAREHRIEEVSACDSSEKRRREEHIPVQHPDLYGMINFCFFLCRVKKLVEWLFIQNRQKSQVADSIGDSLLPGKAGASLE